ncbi:MAG: YdcF family protein [Hyphomicrobiales bacterium]|nr:YdcF family protein [Hyphomicrobiales bacterium]
MFFHASKVLWVLAQPGNLLCLLLLLAAVLSWTRFRRSLRLVLGFLALVVVATTVFSAGDRLVAVLEDRFPAPEPLPAKVDGIIVLGGMINARLSAERGKPMVTTAVERLTEFADLADRYPEARLVFTAGSGDPFSQQFKEAHFVAPFLRRMGIDPARVAYEDQSRNTYENAVFSKRQIAPAAGETWLLVTSAFHMPRAVGCFRRVGWPVIPVPTDFLTAGPEATVLEFSFQHGLYNLTRGVHEVLGLVFYWLTGRSDSLFPAPRAA